MNEHARSPFLTAEEAAKYLRVTESALARWRSGGRGPRYQQPGGPGTRVLYRFEDLEEWVETGDASTDLEEIEATQ